MATRVAVQRARLEGALRSRDGDAAVFLVFREDGTREVAREVTFAGPVTLKFRLRGWGKDNIHAWLETEGEVTTR